MKNNSGSGSGSSSSSSSSSIVNYSMIYPDFQLKINFPPPMLPKKDPNCIRVPVGGIGFGSGGGGQRSSLPGHSDYGPPPPPPPLPPPLPSSSSGSKYCDYNPGNNQEQSDYPEHHCQKQAFAAAKMHEQNQMKHINSAGLKKPSCSLPPPPLPKKNYVPLKMRGICMNIYMANHK